MTIKWILFLLLALSVKQICSSPVCDYPHEFENVETVCECIAKKFQELMLHQYSGIFRTDCNVEKVLFAITDDAWIKTLNGSVDIDSLILLDTTDKTTYVPKKIFTDLPNLKIVQLGGFLWATLPAWSFHNHSSWTEFVLARVGIEEIEENAFGSLPNLTTLKIYFSDIPHLRKNIYLNLPKLKQLSLENNLICNIDDDFFANLKNLEIVTLAENNFTRVDQSWWKGLDRLKELQISGNSFDVLNDTSFGNIPSLAKLKLDGNNIKKISKGAFAGLPQLELLDLSMNSLETIDEDIFEGLQNLQSLFLHGNFNFRRFSYAAGITFRKLKPYVQLGVNLSCDCDFKWIYEVCRPPERCSTNLPACRRENGSIQYGYHTNFSFNIYCPDQ